MTHALHANTMPRPLNLDIHPLLKSPAINKLGPIQIDHVSIGVWDAGCIIHTGVMCECTVQLWLSVCLGIIPLGRILNVRV